MRKIHTYNNGIKCYEDTIFESALSRYQLVNIHEPLEEVIFDHIFCSDTISSFFDVGAAWGYYSLLAHAKNPIVDIYAFEGYGPNYNTLLENIELNNTDRIYPQNKNIAPDQLTLKSALNFTNQKLDLIKIDIQGAATAALRSAGDRITNIKNILLGTHEYGGRTEHKDCLHLLRHHGFDIKINLRPDTVPLQPDGIIWARGHE